jgi:catechol 2,3-dioxygenase-like lactoylglutathione lyase family enzyme
MAVQLNHTIVHTPDPAASAAFVTEVLGLPDASRYGPFHVVEVGNDVSLDFMHDDGEYTPQHYAFLITEDEFDEIFARVTDRDIPYWADPHASQPREINHGDGGRGFYFREETGGHWLEVLTRPYGSSEA